MASTAARIINDTLFKNRQIEDMNDWLWSDEPKRCWRDSYESIAAFEEDHVDHIVMAYFHAVDKLWNIVDDDAEQDD
jgi:hypothetical protein